MTNVYTCLSYKPSSSWRILTHSGIFHSHFICLKYFKSLVGPSGVYRKGIIIQDIMEPTGVLPNWYSCLIIKVDVTVEPFHKTIQINILYAHTVIWSIWDIRKKKQPHSPIHWYEQRPQGPALRPYNNILNFPYILTKKIQPLLVCWSVVQAYSWMKKKVNRSEYSIVQFKKRNHSWYSRLIFWKEAAVSHSCNVFKNNLIY